jgi:hypothetical protein
MKKLLLLLLCVPLIYSCGENQEKEEKTELEENLHWYSEFGQMKMDFSCGDDTNLELLVGTDDDIRSNFNYSQLYDFMETINFYTKFQCNNERTYKPKIIFCYSNKENSNLIDVTMMYVCANSYGVEGDITTYYTIDYSMYKKSIDGDATIEAYEYIIDEKTYE